MTSSHRIEGDGANLCDTPRHVFEGFFRKIEKSDGILMVFDQGKLLNIPYRDLCAAINQYALHLAGVFHIKKGDRVGILAENSIEWILIDLACLCSGIVLVPFDAKVNDEHDDLIAHYGLKILIIGDSQTARSCNQVVSLRDMPIWHKVPKYSSGMLKDPSLTLESIMTFKFTSGSTNRPKAIETKLGNISDCINVIQAEFQFNNSDVIFSFLPLYILQQRYFLYGSILHGYTFATVPSAFALAAISRVNPTVIMAVPQLLRGLIEALKSQLRNTSSVDEAVSRIFGNALSFIWTGSAPALNSDLEYFEKLGIDVLQGYGTAETGIVCKNTKSANKLGSVGRPLPGRHVAIADDGEVFVALKYPPNVKYYCPHTEDGVAPLYYESDGYATGDMGYIDDEGFLFIHGRKRNQIVLSSGRKVAPEAAESVFDGLDLVNKSVVYQEGSLGVSLLLSSDLPQAIIESSETFRSLAVKLLPELRKIYVTSLIFSTENGLLTAQGKVNRRAIEIAFKTIRMIEI